jgi:transposase InsO family protein
MPWRKVQVMDQKLQFVSLSRTKAKPLSQLCKKFGISRPTGYKWLRRANDTDSELIKSLTDRSKRPKTTPTKTPWLIEEKIVALRKEYPYWGAKKLMTLLKERYPDTQIPARRTVDRIIARNGLLSDDSPLGKEYQRFQWPHPNDLWQMDYKGEFLYDGKHYCYPLNVLDDNSRYNLAFDAHKHLKEQTTQLSLIRIFKEYGLPERMLMDQGKLWYSPKSHYHWTKLSVWLIRLGIQLIHSRGRHPQTLGKTERLNKTFLYDYIKRANFHSFEDIQPQFNSFRYEYNHIRPHESLNMQRPADRYVKSHKPYPSKLPAIDYPVNAHVKKLSYVGTLYYRGRYWFISEALPNQPVLLKEQDGLLHVYFIKTLIKTIDLRGANM